MYTCNICIGYFGMPEEEQPACIGCQLLDYSVLHWEGVSLFVPFPYLLPFFNVSYF